MTLLNTIHSIEAEVDLMEKIVNINTKLNNRNMLLVKITEVCRDKGSLDFDTLKVLFGEFLCG